MPIEIKKIPEEPPKDNITDAFGRIMQDMPRVMEKAIELNRDLTGEENADQGIASITDTKSHDPTTPTVNK